MASLQLRRFAQWAVDAVFRLGGEVVKDATYFRPASFIQATGETVSEEIRVAVKIFVVPYQASDLGLVSIQPGDEKVFLRAAELGALKPLPGDYLIETVSGARRDVVSARLDCTDQLWTVQTKLSLNEDWGDLSATSATENWGDLTTATSFEDRLSVV